MQNDFEKQLKQEMANFSLEPNADVWQKVQVRIQQKRKRRTLILWSLACLLLLGGGGYLYFALPLKTHSATAENNKIQQPVTQNIEAKPGAPIPAAKDESQSSETVNPATASSSNAPIKPQVVLPTIGMRTAIPPHNAKEEHVAKKSIANSSRPDQENGMHHLHPDKPEQGAVSETITPYIAKTNPAITTGGEDSNLPDAVKQTDSPVDDTLHIVSSAEPKIEMQKGLVTSPDSTVTPRTMAKKAHSSNWTMGFNLSAGVSTIVRPGRVEKSNPLFAPGSLTNAGSVTGAAPQAFRFSYTPAFSWTGGAYVQKKISKKIAVSAGLNYQYASVKTSVGNRRDSSLTVYDTQLSETRTVNSFYVGGNQQSYVNKYHLLQLPVEVLWQLNRNARKPIEVYGGFTTSMLVGSNALYYNTSRQMIYAQDKQFNQLQLFGQGGLYLPIRSTNALTLKAGPIVQYGLRNMNKSAVPTNDHLMYIGIKSNINFKL